MKRKPMSWWAFSNCVQTRSLNSTSSWISGALTWKPNPSNKKRLAAQRHTGRCGHPPTTCYAGGDETRRMTKQTKYHNSMITLNSLENLKLEKISPALNRKKWDLPLMYDLE